MAFYPLYEDFLKFLRALGQGDAWESYRKYYFEPHREFLLGYWRTFPWMDLSQLRDRVRRIRRGDYSLLEELLASTDLEQLGREVLDRCMEVLPAPREPDVYFMVGFFSPEGFVMEFKGKPVIGFGLERFKSFRLLPIIFAHEYCHYLRRLLNRGLSKDETEGKDETLGEVLLAEGLSAIFSRLAFPEQDLNEHLFLSRARLNWCQQNEERLRELVEAELESSSLVTALFSSGCHQLGLPPRTGYYLGYRFVEDYLLKRSREDLKSIIQARSIVEL